MRTKLQQGREKYCQQRGVWNFNQLSSPFPEKRLKSEKNLQAYVTKRFRLYVISDLA